MARNERHRIRIPGQVLDQIRTKDEEGEYGKDTRFSRKRKVNAKPVSRKDKRKEERRVKKQKRSSGHSDQSNEKLGNNSKFPNPKSSNGNSSRDSDIPLRPLKSFKNLNSKDIQEDPLEALRALKEAKNKSSGEKRTNLEVRIVKEDEIEDLDLEGFSDFDEMEDSEDLDKTPVRLVKEEDLEDLEDFEDFEDPEDLDNPGNFNENNGKDVMAALKAAKEKKAKQIASDSEEFSDLEYQEDPLAALKALKEKKNGTNLKNEKPQKNPKNEKVIEANFVDPIDNDMEFYAKKLGLKNGKSKLSKLDEDDVVGGLLDGLDFDNGSEDDADSDADSDGRSDAEFGSDNYDSEAEFDSDNSDSDNFAPKKKENPFVAPSTDDVPSEEEETQPSAYIPPALRRKMAMESLEVSAELLALQKAIKGPINKLSESNIGAIVNEINALYLSNPRQSVNECLTSIILDSIISQDRLLDTFVFLHSALIVALYRLQGVDFGAYFIQTLIEKYERFHSDPSKSKAALNSMSLLSSVFAFLLVSSKLLYDIIRDLITDLQEKNAELLLKIIRNSGNQMRSEDPTALKEIVLMVTKKSASLSKEQQTPRMQFLIETISSLKNNKLKTENESGHQLILRLKKFLGTFTSSKQADPLQVSLNDIRSVEERGKWWLIGSAWKGHGEEENSQALADVEVINDILDNAEPNWLELARSQRMNTDIRRAIFISIMSANDYVDAMTKLDKLALKKAQEREIPRILIHCAVVEPAWNPYYGILGAKLCDSHSYRKTFQFLLWDLVKGFDKSFNDEDEDEDFAGFDELDNDDDKLKKIINLGRFFGQLFSQGSLALHILRTVNFVAASDDVKLFMEVLLITFLDQIAKKSLVNSIGVGLVNEKTKMSELKFDDRTLIERFLKAKEEPGLLKGMKHFMTKRLLSSDFITGKKQRKRVEWGVKSSIDIIEEFVKDFSF